MPETQNTLILFGQISKSEISHTFMGENFYRFVLDIPRQSGVIDMVPVIASERLLFNNAVNIGDYVQINGQIRTRNEKGEIRNRLIIFGYALEVIKIDKETFDAEEDKNRISFEGFVVKKPNVRETKKGRKIAETIIACNRQHNKSDYIPCIIWGKDAGFARNLETSNRVEVLGRFQSREYPTRGMDGEQVTATAYELSVQKINVAVQQ